MVGEGGPFLILLAIKGWIQMNGPSVNVSITTLCVKVLGTRILPTLQLLNQWSIRDDQSPRTRISKQSKQLH